MSDFVEIDEQDQSTFPQLYRPVRYYYKIKRETYGPVVGYYHEEDRWLIFEDPIAMTDPGKWYRAIRWQYVKEE